jgi:hypothetical protein
MGRYKLIESPDFLWDLFKKYKEYIKNKPIIVKDWVGKDASSVYREKEKPLTIEGFENWLEDNEIITHLSDYFANTDKRYSDFTTICSRIKRNIRQDQIEGGMAGIYNPSITQRLNGLVDKKETELKGSINIPKLPDIGNRI